jgi:2-oxoglutarate ferredoxin oxidoreductase subunit delta
MKTGKKGQTRVVVYGDWCKGCGICAAFCPGSVMEVSVLGKAVVVREDECINCGFCELHCPDFAISVRPRERRAAAKAKPDAGARTGDAPGKDRT